MRPFHAQSLTAILMATTALSPPLSRPVMAQSLPTGASVAYGSVGIRRSSGSLTINQSSQDAILNYKSFSIGQGKTVDIKQPNASSTLLNRVTGDTPSTIAGRLNANGQVYLINPNGIAITKTGVVKVGGGFVASTLDMTDDEFKNGRKQFKGNGVSAPVTNAGTITIGRGGYAALIGGTVTNSGLISVPMGKVGLGSGEAATLDVSGDGFLQVTVPTTSGGKDALIQQSGTISATGGMVVLDAATARAAARNAVNISGGIDAHSISGSSGNILIGGGDGGAVAITGPLSVASRSGMGGSVTVTGRTIALTHARIDASGSTGGGTVKIGGDLHGGGTLAHAGTVTIDAKSVIKADARSKGNGGNLVVWSDETTSFAGLISAKGGAEGGDGGNVEVSSHGVLNYTGLTMLTAAKGAAGTLLLDPYNVVISTGTTTNETNSNGTYTPSGTSVISNANLNVQLAAGNVTITTAGAGSDAGNITVAAPIAWNTGSLLTMTATNAIAINANISINGGGKLALNTGTTSFMGGLGGNSTQPLLSFAQGASVTYAAGSGTGIAGQALSINGTGYTLEYSLNALQSAAAATPAGNYALAQSVDGSNGGAGYTTGVIAGGGSSFTPPTAFSGTLEGLGNTVSNLKINGGGNNYIGLVGYSTGTVRDIGVVGGSISGANYVGDLVGYLAGNGAVMQTYATGAVSGTSQDIGGLVGGDESVITQSYATGAVSGADLTSGYVGGLTGFEGFRVIQSYATGAVSGYANVGGLAGGNNSGSSEIIQSYATGAVSGTSSGASNVGALVGINGSQPVTNSYWNTQTAGSSLPGFGDGGTQTAAGLTTTQLQDGSSASGLGSAFTVTSGLNPFLANFFPSGVQAVSGKVYNGATPFASGAGGAVAVTVAGANAALGTATTGADGSYYVFGPAGTIGNGASLIAYTTTNGATGTTNAARLASSTYTAGTPAQGGADIYEASPLTFATTSQTTYSGYLTSVGTLPTAPTVPTGTAVPTFLANVVPSVVTTGTSFTIDTPATISSQIGFATILSGAPVTVANAVTVANGGRLGLSAAGALAVNAPMSAWGAAGVALAYDRNSTTPSITDFSFAQGSGLTYLSSTGSVLSSSAGGTLAINGTSYALEYSLAALASAANGAPAGAYALARGVDGSNAGAGYAAAPITSFSGTFEGLGNAIANLTITDPSSAYVGLIGQNSGTLRDIGVIGGTVTANAGGASVGDLVGFNNPTGVVANAFATGAVASGAPGSSGSIAYAGGLVGFNNGGVITNASATGAVTGNSFAEVGGLAGENYQGTITNAYATGAASGGANAITGGLAGQNYDGTITNVYATGAASGSGSSVGGLVGLNNNGGAITNAFAMGAASGGSNSGVGGLVGWNYSPQHTSTITNAYATGFVSSGSNSSLGGLVGLMNGGTVTNGYFDTGTSGLTRDTGGATGQSTGALQTAAAAGNLGSAFAGGAGLYPYLKSLDANGVQAISGIAYTNVGVTPAAGATVGVIAGGQSFGNASAGRNGYYFAFAPAGTAPNDAGGASTLLAYGTTSSEAILTSVAGTAVSGAGASTAQTGVNLSGYTLTGSVADTTLSAASTSIVTNANAAANGNATALFAISHTMNRDYIATGASFTVDQAVSAAAFGVQTLAANAPIIVAKPITISDGGSLGLSAAGALTIDAPITAKGAVAVNLSAATSIVPGTTTSVLDLAFAQGDAITFTDASGAALNTAPTSGAGTLSVNGTPYTLLYNMTDLGNVTLGGASAMAGNLYATSDGTATGTPTAYNNAIIAPLGGSSFTGTFDGLGHTISALTIFGGNNNHGLFGTIGAGGTVRDVGIVGGTVSGGNNVGALAGNNGGTVTQAYATSAVNGFQNVGGLIGENDGTLTQSYAGGVVVGGNSFGFTGSQDGGLVGLNVGTITRAYATSRVEGFGASTNIGGLVGENLIGKINQAYATGLVTVGGGSTNIGGLVGANTHGGSVANSYYDSGTTGQPIDGGGATGLTTVQLQGGQAAGLGSAFGGGTGGLYPYLASFFPTGVQAISGFAYADLGATPLAGNSVSVIAGGQSFGSSTTGANGYYYVVAPAGTAANGTNNLLAYTGSSSATLASLAGNAVSGAGSSTVQAGVDLYGNMLTALTTATSLTGFDGVGRIGFSGALATARSQALPADGGNMAATAAINGAAGVGLVASGASFTIDQTVSASGPFLVQTTASGAPITVASGNPITIQSGGALGLLSAGALTVNAPVTAHGAVAMNLAYDQNTTTPSATDLAFAQGAPLTFVDANGSAASSSQGGTLAINGTSYTLDYSLASLASDIGGNANPSHAYALATSVDGSNGGAGYTASPIGGFSGTLEGLGNTVTNLTINAPSSDNIGLIGSNSGAVRDIGIVGGSVTGHYYVGGLVGDNNPGGSITNAYATDAASGVINVGGLVGLNGYFGSVPSATIANAYATGAIFASNSDAGGLAGMSWYTGIVTNAYATGAVRGGFDNGGLIGVNYGSVTNVYATGAVSGGRIGALISRNSGTVTNGYWDQQTVGSSLAGIAINNGQAPTGLSTSQFQTGAAATNLGSAFGGGTGLFPYLTSFFPNGVEAVSGTVYNGVTPFASNGGGAVTVTVAGANASLGTATTGADGTYYVFGQPGTIAGGTNFIAYTMANGTPGITNAAGIATSTYNAASAPAQTGGFIYESSPLSFATTTQTTYSGYLAAVGGTLPSAPSVPTGTTIPGFVASAVPAVVTTGSSFTIDTPATISSPIGFATALSGAPITVANAVTVANGGGLGLYAAGALTIDAPITVKGAAQVALSAAYDTTTVPGASLLELAFGNGAGLTFTKTDGSAAAASAGGSLTINGTAYTLLYNLAQPGSAGPDSGTDDLAGIDFNGTAGGDAGHYALATNLTGTGTAASPQFGGPLVGGEGTNFTGVLEGLGHTITNLTMADSSGNLGLFAINAGTIRDIGLVGGSVASSNTNGAFVGSLVGWNIGHGIVANAASSATMSGADEAMTGGLVGYSQAFSSNDVVAIVNSYATGSVSAGANFASAGGLVGEVGVFNGTSTVINSYATGPVRVGDSGFAGGLTGLNQGTIASSYSTGAVTHTGMPSGIGGLVGTTQQGGTVSHSYYDIQTSGQTSDGGGATGLTTAQLQGGGANLGTAFGGGTGGLYPYLASFFPNGVQAVSGVATTATGVPLTPGAAGSNIVSVLVNGQSFGSATTGANGYYYIVEPTGGIASGASVLAYTSANATGAANGASLLSATSASNQQNVDIFGNAVTVATNSTSLTGYLGANTFAQVQSNAQQAALAADGGNGAATAAIDGLTGLGLVASGAGFTINAPGTQTLALTAPLFVQTTGAQAPITVTNSVTVGTGATLGLYTTSTGVPIAVAQQIMVMDGANLSLDASGALAINANVTVPGTGTVALAYDQNTAGPNVSDLSFAQGSSLSFMGADTNGNPLGTLAINGKSYTLLNALAQTHSTGPDQGVNDVAGIDNADATGHYALATNLTGARTTFDGALAGTEFSGFTGTFEGLGHTITSLSMATNGSAGFTGLFGQVGTGGTVRDVGLVGGTINGANNSAVTVGSLASTNRGTIANSYATTSVVANGSSSGQALAGGLVGDNEGAIVNSYSTGAVSAVNGTFTYAGGLVGNNNGTITNTFATGTALASGTGPATAGGLVGGNLGSIASSYSTGVAIANGSTNFAGGLAGVSNPNTSINSYFDIGTSGVSVDGANGSATGLTTAQLQSGAANAALGSAFAGGANGLYPYLASFFPNGVQAISGTAYTNAGVTPAASGATGVVTVGLIAGGQSFGSATTGANGYFYAFAPAGTAANGTNNLLAYSNVLNGAALSSLAGTAVAGASSSTLDAGVALYGNAVTVPTNATGLKAFGGGTTFAAALSTAQLLAGSADDGAGDAHAAITNAAGLGLIASGASFTIDAPVTTSGTFLVETRTGAPLTVASGDPITVASGGSLGLLSGGALAVDAPIIAKGAAQVALAYDASNPANLAFAQGDALTFTDQNGNPITAAPTTGAGALSVNGQAYTLLYAMGDVANVNANLGGAYALAGDIDAGASGPYTTGVIAGGTNNPGSTPTPFSGTLEGLGHTVSNLTISGSPAFNSFVGLIGYNAGTVRDIGLRGGSVSGYLKVGALAGLNFGTIAQAYATGAVGGVGGSAGSIGGLVGDNAGAVSQAYATGAVSGTNSVGGLVGLNRGNGTITQAYATGAVPGGNGLVGQNLLGTVTKGYYDENTTGQPDGVQGDGSVGLTTRQLQGLDSLSGGTITDPGHLGCAFRGGAGGLYPYLSSFFPNGVEAVSGTAQTGAGANLAGGQVGVYAGGRLITGGTASTGANGYFYEALPAGTLPGTNITIGATLTRSGGTSPSGLVYNDAATASGGIVSLGTLTDGTVSETTARASYSALQTDLGTTFGAPTLASLQTMIGASNIAVTGTSNAGLSVDQAVTTTGNLSLAAIGTNAPLTVGASLGADNVGLASTNGAIDQTGGAITATTLQASASGDVSLTASGNAVGKLAALKSTGNVAFTDSLGFTVGPNTLGDRVSASSSGSITLVSTGGGITLASGSTSMSGGSALIAADGAFTNNAGSGAITTTNGFTIYTQNAADPSHTLPTNVIGGLTGLNWYNDAYTFSSGTFAGTIPSGNHFVYAYQASLMPVLGGNASRTYDGTSTAPTSSLALSTTFVNTNGIADGATFSFTGAAYADANAGTGKNVTASGIALASNPNNYTLGSATASAAIGTITPAALTITASNQSKTYGQTAALGTTAFTETGLVSGVDTLTGVTLASAGSGAAANVGGYAINASAAQGTGLSNYTISYSAGQFTVNPAALTITASNQAKTYGQTAALGSTAFTETGLVTANGDTLTGVTLASAGSAGAANVGGYAINASAAQGTGLSNYTISYSGGQLIVNPAALTITASNQAKTYGQTAALGSTTFSETGLVTANGDTLTAVMLASAGSGAAATVGSYAINASAAQGTNLSNYTISYSAGQLTVNPAALTITASNQTKTYGQTAALGSTAFTDTGLVTANGDTLTGVTLASAGSGAAANAGGYAINASAAQGMGLSNYTISYNAGQLIVNPAALTITANNVSKVYGAAVPTLTASYSGFVNGDTAASLITVPTLTTTATARSSVAGGPYAITASGAVDPNYAITYTAGSLTVTPAALTIAANSASKVYGAAVPTLTASYTGFVNGDTPASLTAGPTLATAATATSATANQPYAITASGAVDSNYAISYSAGQLTVTPAALTITASNQAKTYGQAATLGTSAFSETGLVSGVDTLTGVTLASAGSGAAANVGGYAINASAAQGTGLSNYTISYVQGSLAVNPLAVHLTGTQVYAGATNVAGSNLAVSNIVNGDSVTVVGASTMAGKDVGGEALTSLAGLTLSNTNYTLIGGSGTVTVTPVTLTYTANAASRTYGGADPIFSGAVTGFVGGDTLSNATTGSIEFSSSATSASGVGRYAIAGVGLTADHGDYVFTQASGNATALTVTPVALTISANNASKIYGTAVPTLTASYTGFVNGDTAASLTTGPVLTTTARASSSVAGGPYAITAGGANDPNYTISYSPGLLTVTPAALTVTADNQVRPPQTANPPLTYRSQGLVGGDRLTGALTTKAASTSLPGAYAITQGTLAAGGNYDLTFVPGTLTVAASAGLTATGLGSTIDQGLLQMFGRPRDEAPFPSLARLGLLPGADGALISQIVRDLGDPRFDDIIVCLKGTCTLVPVPRRTSQETNNLQTSTR